MSAFSQYIISLLRKLSLSVARLVRLFSWCWYYFFKYDGEPLEGLFNHICAMSMIHKDQLYWKLYVGFKRIYVLHRPESAEALLSSPTQIQKSFEYSLLKPWLNDGLVMSTGAKWKIRRRMITPTFHFKILEDFIPIFNEQTQILIKKLNKLEGVTIDILPLMSMCSLDIICETAMGCQLESQNDKKLLYVDSLKKVQQILNYRLLNPFIWPDIIFYLTPYGRQLRKSLDIMNNFTMKVIMARREEFKQMLMQGKCPTNPEQEFITRRRRAFLDMLLYYHLVEGSMGLDDIKEEVDTFMFAGHDSSALMISGVLFMLGSHPDIQHRAWEELDEIFGDDVERPVTLEDTRKMRYTDCVMKETLRLYSGLPFIARHLTEDLKIGDRTIPANSTAMILTYMLHKNPDIYPNPEIFDPDRFLPENVNQRHPFAFLGFSAGSRSCVGQRFAKVEQKAILANILRKFKVTAMIKRDQMRFIPEMVISPKPGILIKLEKRTTSNSTA